MGKSKHAEMKKNNHKILKIIIIVLAILTILGGAAFFAFNYLFGDMKIDNITDSDEELGVSTETKQLSEETNIVNIALFGLDGRDMSVDEGRTDSLMILSVDKNNNIIKLTSILRDSYVEIEGYAPQKINHAYSYGGPVLAIKTINQNFDLDVKDYVAVNFEQFINIVDVLGGVDITITEAEASKIPGVSGAGTVHLNGEQALAYSRIRYIDSDSVRANRQKKVLEAILENIKGCSTAKYIELVKTIMPSVVTSLDYSTIISYSSLITSGNASVQENSVPNKADHPIGGIYEGAWVWRYDISAAAQRLHEFIYGDRAGDSL